MGDFEIDPEREAEMREELLAFSECMREHGIDMPDPVFSERRRGWRWGHRPAMARPSTTKSSRRPPRSATRATAW